MTQKTDRTGFRLGRGMAITEGLLVALIWSSSFVLVKYALDSMGPLTIGGIRYFLAFLLLLPFFRRSGSHRVSLTPTLWKRLFLIGVSAYVVGNGALFWSLKYLPATSSSFLMSFIPLLVLLASVFWLKEIPSRLQVVGLAVCLLGSALFFSPGLKPGEPLGIIILGVGMVGFALFGILARQVARHRQTDTLTLTAIPLGIGGGLLMILAVFIEGLPELEISAWAVVLWLAAVNTSFANTLYNHALQALTAVEMNVILNLSPLGTALLAWILLGENLGAVQLAGMALTVAGVIIVQLPRRKTGQSDVNEGPPTPKME